MSRLGSLIRQDGPSNESVTVRSKESGGDQATCVDPCNALQKASCSGSRLTRLMQPSAKSSPLKRGCSSQIVKRHCDRSTSTGKPKKAICTDYAHKLRHPTFDASCPRCAFLEYGSQWRRIATWKFPTVCRSWLAPKPSHLGGQWALGCLACAALLESPKYSTCAPTRKYGKWQAGRRANSWARFRVTRLLKTDQAASAFSQHQMSTCPQGGHVAATGDRHTDLGDIRASFCDNISAASLVYTRGRLDRRGKLDDGGRFDRCAG